MHSINVQYLFRNKVKRCTVLEIQNIDQGHDFIIKINRQNENEMCKNLYLLPCLSTLSRRRTEPERHHGVTRHKYTFILATFKPRQILYPSVKILQILEFTFYYIEDG